MSTRDLTLAERWPVLFSGHKWGRTDMLGMRWLDGVIDRLPMQSVNMVPFVGDQVVIPVTTSHKPLLPGGTREFGETLLQTISREVFEECGATLKNCHAFAILDCYSHDPRPWRPHLSHPTFTRLVCLGDVELTARPINGSGMESIGRVELMSIDDATAFLTKHKRPELAAIYECATFLRSDKSAMINLIKYSSAEDS